MNDLDFSTRKVVTPGCLQGVSIIELKCKVRFKECGDFHTIKWYKEPFTTRDNEKSERSALQDIRDNIVNPVDRLLESHAERVYLLFKSKGKAEGSWSGTPLRFSPILLV